VTIAWISYGIVVSGLVSIGAESAHVLGRRAGLPTRWVWTSAIGLIVVLIAIAPYRQTSSTERIDEIFVRPTQPPEASSLRIRLEQPRAWQLTRRAVIVPVERGIATIERRLPRSANYYLIGLWILASSTFLSVMACVYIRINRVRRLWDTTILCGRRVRVAPEMGPAVVGLANPEIVVPRSLLDRNDEEVNLVITHESEHLQARDPMLLLFGCVVAALIPWNPALWWMLRRLQLAVELDCDARMLRSGVAPRTYGSLLIDLAEQCSGFPAGAPALVGIQSHLHQRLVAMKPDTRRLSIPRAVIVSSLSLISLLVACETNLPTSADVSRMDAASAEHAARGLTLTADTITFMVDGSIVTAQAAHAVRADSIASISLWKQAGGKAQTISISTRGARDSVKHVAWTRVAPNVDLRQSQPYRTLSGEAQGLYLINGARVDQAAVKALDPKAIARIEIIKGPAARKLYNDPLAANGVISITTHTKKGQ
jgi:beta-lactamase regulating signal transducer with metallopeptidase domain